MNGKLYIKKFIRDDGETLSFDAEEIYLSENNTLLVRSDPATTAVEFTEEDGGEMIRQRGATYSQPVSGLIVPKSTEYWALCVRLSRFFILNHTYKIVYIKRDGSMFSMNRAWINAGLQIVPVPYENYSTWTIEFRIGDNFWTEYAEDSQGKEIYSNSVELPLLTAGTGGEVWGDVTQQTLSGIGNYFTIDGTSISASINKLELKGDTYQQTYSGKNLFPLGTGRYTNHGFTSVNNADGSITVSGTAEITYANITTNRVVNYEQGKTYTLSIKEALPCSIGAILTGSGTTREDINVNVGSTSGKRTLNQTHTTAALYIFNLTVGQSYSFTVYPMIEEGSTASPFEPYTGGIPAPNPDYPQNIQTVTGEQTVEVTGKNLFKMRSGTYSNNGLTYNFQENSVTVSGTTSGVSTNNLVSNSMTLRKGVTYTVSTSNSALPTGSQLKWRRASDNNDQTGITLEMDVANASKTFVLDEDIELMPYLRFPKGTTFTDVVIKPQLEVGSTATAYEPYQSQSYEVNLGKNLLNLSLTFNDHGINSTWHGNSVTISGETTGSYANLTSNDAQFLPAGTYTFSMKNTSSAYRASLRIRYNDTNYVYSIEKGSSSVSFTAPTEFSIRVLYLDGFTTGTTLSGTIDFQLELGSTATSYAPYFTPIELCKIGDYQDYIYKSGDDWYVHKEVGKVVLDGTIGGFNSENDWYYAGVGASDISPATTQTLSNYFTASNESYMIDHKTVDGLCAVNHSKTHFILRNLDCTSANEYRTWLGRTNPIFYYPLATATDTQITDITLVAQLNALAEARSYDDKTVYQTDSATMPAILSVELLQSVGGGEVWDNVGAVWEEGVGGVQTINVETTQTTYPVWTVTGPCSNPTLQNDTTDTIASFDGMIASGQTLTVDFADNTAYLDSAPVAKYVSGYVSLAPGENVIGFNSDGGSTQTSTISWDNIIN